MFTKLEKCIGENEQLSTSHNYFLILSIVEDTLNFNELNNTSPIFVGILYFMCLPVTDIKKTITFWRFLITDAIEEKPISQFNLTSIFLNDMIWNLVNFIRENDWYSLIGGTEIVKNLICLFQLVIPFIILMSWFNLFCSLNFNFSWKFF